MGTTTTIVKPNYTYAGAPTRTVRADSMFVAPRLTLGGPRTQIPLDNSQVLPNRYGVSAYDYQGNRALNGSNQPWEHSFFQSSPVAPGAQDGGNNGAPIVSPSGGQPSAGPAALSGTNRGVSAYAPTMMAAAPDAGVAPAPAAITSDAPAKKAPIVSSGGDGDDIGSILSGVASAGNMLGGAIGGAKSAAGQGMLAAGAGVAPPKADTSMLGRSRDYFTGMFGGPTRANIDAAYARSQIDPATLPGGPSVQAGRVNGMQVGGDPSSASMFDMPQPVALGSGPIRRTMFRG